MDFQSGVSELFKFSRAMSLMSSLDFQSSVSDEFQRFPENMYD